MKMKKIILIMKISQPDLRKKMEAYSGRIPKDPE